MTRRMGKSFAQLLTSSAVLIAVGLAAVGGGSGLMRWRGAVDVRRGGGGRCKTGAALPGAIEGSGGVVISPEGAGLGATFVWETAGFGCWFVWVFTGCAEGEGRMPGVGGPGTVGVVSPVLPAMGWRVAVSLLESCAPYRRDFGTRIKASRRTVRWWASVAAAFRVRKKRYWTMMGARAMKVVARDGSFSRRAQVR